MKSAIDLLQAARNGDLLSREVLNNFNLNLHRVDSSYKKINNNIQSEGVSDDLPAPLKGCDIAQIAREFHKKSNTLHSGVRNELRKLENGCPRIRVAHQPNTFPYLGVMAQFIILDLISRSLSRNTDLDDPCQLFLVVDHDGCDDQWFRAAHLPDPLKKQGVQSLSKPVLKNEKNVIMGSATTPNRSQVTEWIKKVEDVAKLHNSQVSPQNTYGIHPDHLAEQLELVGKLVTSPLDGAESWGEYNAMVISRVVNNHWDLPTLFLPLSACSSYLQPHYEYIIKRWDDVLKALKEVIDYFESNNVSLNDGIYKRTEKPPFWYLCPSCQSRYPVRSNEDNHLFVDTFCSTCNIHLNQEFGSFEEPCLDGCSHQVAPRVILDNLLDYIGMGIEGGVGYESSFEHVLATHAIAKQLNWPIPPECYWRPYGLYGTPTEVVAKDMLDDATGNHVAAGVGKAVRLIHNGRATILYNIVFNGVNRILNSWRGHFHHGGSVADPNYAWKQTEWTEKALSVV